MESYYSSDEEIAWGPITLREIKSDLKRPVRKPKKRHSMPYNFQMGSQAVYRNVSASPPEDATELCQKVADKFSVSQASTEYFTPNESLMTNNKYDFLEKVSKVINEPPSQLSSYVSALDTTKTSALTNVSIPNSDNSYHTATGSKISMNDTYLNFVKKATERETHYDIANFRHTLVRSPVTPEGELAIGVGEEQLLSNDEDDLCENNVSHNVSGKDTTDENIIVLSDDETSGNSISFREDSFDSQPESRYLHNEGASYCRDKVSENSEQVNETVDVTVPRPLSTIPEKISLSTSPISLPEIDLAECDASVSLNESLHLNDTIEEMNRLLNQGLNYTVSDDESEIIDSTPLKSEPKLELQFTPSNIISGSFSQNQTPIQTCSDKLKTTKTPSEKRQIPRYNVKRTPDSHFKIPEKPVRAKLTNPTPPKSCPSHLKNVMSPVALYIKNSPNVPLKQNIPQRELTKITPSRIPKVSTKENFPDLPEVVYKPSKKQISSCEKQIVLPSCIKRLNVKEPSITKHEGRIHQSTCGTKASRKLLQDDVSDNSINCSVLNSSKDISVLTKKQAFIK